MAGTSGHFPGRGSLNARADKLSRRCLADHKWHLHPEVVQGLFEQWGEPWLDLFATTENVQCQHFCALEFPKRLSHRDTFHLKWTSGLLYAFPSIPLLPQVLKKIRTNRAQVILVALDWARRVWYPELLGMSISPLIRLPLRVDLLSQQQVRVLHPNLCTLHLHAWRLSSLTVFDHPPRVVVNLAARCPSTKICIRPSLGQICGLVLYLAD